MQAETSGSDAAGLEAQRGGEDPAELRDRILSRLPTGLPRAEAGRWIGIYPAATAGELGSWLSEASIERLQFAENCYRSRRYPEALTALYDLLEAEPDLPLALQLLGTTYFRLRRYGDCRDCMLRFIDAAPSELWRTQALGHCYYSLGDYQAAADHYERVLVGLPDSLEALRGLALSLGRLGEEDRALELLDHVIELDADHSDALCARAQIRFDRGDSAAALADVRRANAAEPWEPRPLFLMVKILRDLEEHEDADRVEGRWRELDAWTQRIRSLEDRMAYGRSVYSCAVELVDLYQKTGDHEGLRRAIDAAVSHAPKDVPRYDLYVYSLDAFEAAGDEPAAQLAAESLARDFAERPDTWQRLEAFYGKRRDRKRQVEAGEKYLRLTGR